MVLDNNNHYKTQDPAFEPIEVIECMELGFHLGNAVKYIARAGKKDGNTELQDLKKALWYLQDKIKDLENEQD